MTVTSKSKKPKKRKSSKEYAATVAAAQTLTGNDIALASFACALAIAWHKNNDAKKCAYTKREIAKYQALCSKLQFISMNAYPEYEAEGERRTCGDGDEEIMRFDEAVLKRIVASEIVSAALSDGRLRMAETKEFHLGDVLSITTGYLVSPRHMGGVYDILNWMTGESLYTHQLPRVTREAAPVLLAALPQLAPVEVPDFPAPEHVATWLTEQVALYGEMLPVPKFTPKKS